MKTQKTPRLAASSICTAVIASCSIAALVAVLSCGHEARARAVPGPENSTTTLGLRGWVVMDKPVGGLVAVDVATGAERLVRAPGSDIGTVHSVSGPDRNGRIVFVENHMVEKHHAIRVVQLDGSGERTVLERNGDALWGFDGDEIGDHLALAPDGGSVAFVRDLAGVKIPSAKLLVMRGTLVVLDLERGDTLPLDTKSIDEPPSWFPDGRRIAYTDVVERESVRDALRELQADAMQPFAASLASWERVPAIHVLDLGSGQVESVHVGWRASVSPDGLRLLVSDLEHHWRIVDLAARSSRAVSAPGATNLDVVAWLDAHRVLYWSLPTEGAALRMTDNNSPLVGPKPMLALKCLDLDGGGFATLVPSLDPRRRIGFGVGR